MSRKKRGNILVVDDDAGMRELLTLVLTNEGYTVVSAANGSEALAIIEQCTQKTDEKSSVEIDLTLMDIKMSPPGGIEVMRQLRAWDPDAVVVLFTGYASLETAIQAMRYGAYDYVDKPLSDVNKLLAVVQRGLDRHRLLTNSRRLLAQLGQAYEENLRLLKEMQAMNRDLEVRILERTQELEKANRQLKGLDRLKSELLTNISHELYTPLNAIIGFSQALMDGLHGPLLKAQARLVKSIQDSGKRLKGSFDDLIDMAQLSASEVVVHPRSIPLTPLLDGIKALVEQSSQKKDIDIKLEIVTGVKVIWADEAKLKRMLYELLSNAIKFTSAGGRVVLRAFLHPPEGPRELRLAISDTGIGIPADKLEEIFDPFRQVDSSLSRSFGGLGLGLAVVRYYAKLHGGHVWAESELGLGSTFTLALPLSSTLDK